MRNLPVLLAIGVVSVAASVGMGGIGCGGSSGGSGFGDDGSGGGNGDGGGSGSNPTLDGSISLGDSGSSSNGGCSAAAELVYVFATDNSIYSFNPPSKTFTKIATADCQTSMMPNSMAIDRNLVAWLNYFESGSNGALFKFDLNAKTGCTQAATLKNGYGQVGMGFSSDTSGGTAETLYLDGIGGNAGLASFNMSTNAVVPIGTFTSDPALSGQSAELTGTGDARLFGYFTTSPDVRVAQLDKTTASVISDNVLQNFPPPQDWAFSFWGGDFYLYTSDGVTDSKVVHYAPGTGMVDLEYVADVGFTIIGAGVSTCAPVVAPP